ncbi:MAG: trimethylamine methyltransferase family protein, partial [Anaerolineae bacterium]
MSKQISIETLHPAVRVLSDEQIQALHSTSLDILLRTGIVIKSEAGRELLLEAGAWESDDDGPAQGEKRIKIPEHLLMQGIASAPSRILMHNRLGELTMPLEGDNVFFGPGSDCIYTWDLAARERRLATADDVQRFAHLSDGLDGIDFVMSMGT